MVLILCYFEILRHFESFSMMLWPHCRCTDGLQLLEATSGGPGNVLTVSRVLYLWEMILGIIPVKFPSVADDLEGNLKKSKKI